VIVIGWIHSFSQDARRRAGVLRSALILALPLAFGGCAWLLPQSEALRVQWPGDLEQRVELDGVPFFPQEDYRCGPASLATVMTSGGIGVAPDDLVSKVYLPNRGGSLQVEMLAAPRPYGLVSWRLAPRFADLLREVQAGTPVIVMQDYWHYAVVVGFDRNTGKAVLRSGEKRRLEIPFAVLEYTWKESAYWALAVLPPDRVPATADEASWLQAVVAMERVAEPNAAREAYRAALRRWPESLNGAIGLANVDYAQGDLQEAESVLREAVKHHPTSVVALNNLAQAVADQNRNEEALALIDEAVALGGPFSAAAEQTRAQIRKKMAAPQ
jgi:antitoxin (DNA-binding transcriptional repressor) of toxin-antitoxin stability system